MNFCSLKSEFEKKGSECQILAGEIERLWKLNVSCFWNQIEIQKPLLKQSNDQASWNWYEDVEKTESIFILSNRSEYPEDKSSITKDERHLQLNTEENTEKLTGKDSSGTEQSSYFDEALTKNFKAIPKFDKSQKFKINEGFSSEKFKLGS